jgi:hypothetical protein
MILDSDDWPTWLGEVPTNDNQLKGCSSSELLAIWPVDRSAEPIDV